MMRRLGLLLVLAGACADEDATCPGDAATQVVQRDITLPVLEVSQLEGRTMVRI